MLHRQEWTPFNAENDRLTDSMVDGIVNNKANNFMTSGNAVIIFEVTKYLSMSEILLRKFFR
jgi:hypothetical protein